MRYCVISEGTLLTAYMSVHCSEWRLYSWTVCTEKPNFHFYFHDNCEFLLSVHLYNSCASVHSILAHIIFIVFQGYTPTFTMFLSVIATLQDMAPTLIEFSSLCISLLTVFTTSSLTEYFLSLGECLTYFLFFSFCYGIYFLCTGMMPDFKYL